MDSEVGDHEEDLKGEEYNMETTTEPDGGGLSRLFKGIGKKSTNDTRVQPSAEKDGTSIPCSSSDDQESSSTQVIPAYVILSF